MNINHTKMTLEINSCKNYEILEVRQGDKGSRIIDFAFTVNGETVNLASTMSAKVNATVDDVIVADSVAAVVDTENNVVTVTLTDTMLALSGICKMDIVLMEGNEIITAETVCLRIGKSVINGDSKAFPGASSIADITKEVENARGAQNSLGARLDTADANLAKKANKSDIDSINSRLQSAEQNLHSKANATDVSNALKSKEDTSNKVSSKTDITDSSTNYPSIKYLNDYYYDANESYSSAETDELLGNKADSNSVYSKVDTDNLLGEKADKADVTNQFSELKEDLAGMHEIYQSITRNIETGKNYIIFSCIVGNKYNITNRTSDTIAIKTMLNKEVIQSVREALPAGASIEFECTGEADTIYVYANSSGKLIIENISSWYHTVNKNLQNMNVFLNAKDYGVSTDSEDNHDAIILAINDAIAKGKPLYFEAGNYVTSEIELTYPNQLRIVGTGYNKSNATIFRPKTGSKIITFYGGNCCYFEKLFFQGTVSLSDNSPDTSDCRFNDLYFNDCTFSYNGYGVKIDSPCGYVKFERCAFACVKAISIGENFNNNVSVIPNYIYIINCEFFGLKNINCCGVMIQKCRVIKIQNCDFAGFNTDYPALRVYASGVVDYVDITENMFMNTLFPISIQTALDSGYIQRVRINSNGLELMDGGKGVYVDGGVTAGGTFELQIVGNLTSGATLKQLSGYVFSVNNVGTLTFAQNEAHALLLAKDCVSFTNVSKLTDKSYMSDGSNIIINPGETKSVKFGYKRMWYSANKNIWHTGDNITYSKTYDNDTNELTVSFTNNSNHTQNIHADLM